MKKICIFLPYIGGGGLTQVMLNLAGGLVNKGYKVELVILDINIPSFLNAKIPDNVKLIRLRSKRILTSIFPLGHYIRNSKPNVLLSGGPPSNCISILAKIIFRVHCTQIITEHSLPSVDVFDSNKIVDRLIPFLMRRLYRKADRIVSVSNSVAKDLSVFISIDIKKICVIYNPVVTESLFVRSRERVEHKWLNDCRYKVILFVGRLEKVKNLEFAIKAFSCINNDRVKFIIVGDGSERKKLEQFSMSLNVFDDVDFVGYSSNPYAYMSNSSALILCSKWEGLPTVLVEAMACGIPVVATDNLDGAKEILNYGEINYLVENQDHIKFGQVMLRAINNRYDPNKLVDRAMDFSLENSVNEYIKIF